MTLAAMKLSWYVARSAGWVAWLVCASAIIWGLMLSSRLVRRRGAPAWLLDLHRFLGLLSVVFTVVHLAGLWFDDYLTFRFRELLVPGASPYRPLAVAWGVVALYLLLAVQVTSWMMKRLPRKWWHRVHLSSFALFALATLHGFTAGADAGNMVLQWMVLGVVAALIFLTVFRLVVDRRAARTGRIPEAARTRAIEDANAALAG